MSKKLYNLIKSMSPIEKAHFKKYSSNHIHSGPKTYVRLFDVIDKMNEYTASHLQSAFETKKTIQDISAYSNYLFRNIMDALKVYHANKTIDSRIKQMLSDIEILFLKSLYREAEKIVEKAYNEALKYECFLLLPEILSWEEKLARIPGNIKLMEKVIKNYERQTDILNKLAIHQQYEQLVNRISYLVTRNGLHIKNKTESKKLEKIMLHPLLVSEKKAISNSDKDLYYIIHGYYNFIKLKQDLNKSVKYLLKRKELYESKIEWGSQYLKQYLNMLDALFNRYGQLRQLKEFDKIMNEIKRVPERFGNKIPEKFENLRLAIINKQFFARCFISKEYEKGLAAVKGKEAEWEMIQAKVEPNYSLVFYSNMFELFIAVGDFKKALPWNNKMLNSPESSIRPDLYINARVWNIIIHYELDNYELIESLVQTTFQLIKNEKMSYSFERLFLHKMQEIVNAHYKSGKEINNAFLNFKKELVAMKNKTDEIRDMDYMEYMNWLDTHIK